MYAAIAHQLHNRYTSQNLRAQAAIFMREHSDDFAPFITHPDTGDMLSPEEFLEYCDNIENTNTWGGEPEVRIHNTLKNFYLFLCSSESFFK